MKTILNIKNVTKTYKNSLKALKDVNLDIKSGEIFALLGPNGAGKSTLINAVCGIVNFDKGSIKVNDLDIIKNYRETRKIVGIVPQELYLESFETVWNNVNYSRGLFGKSKNHIYIEKLLKDLSLWDKKDSKIKELSGGMKRRVLIAKALSHEPKILFLDEPTASVDVELRKDMWDVVKKLNKNGVTIILTTHYIEEAEELSDRVAIINDGKIILVEEKNSLIKKLGEKTIKIELTDKIEKINGNLSKYNFVVDETKKFLSYSYNLNSGETDLTGLLNDIKDEGLILKDIITEQSSLEEIFIKLIKENNELVRN
tara:strand:+ start:26 stop:967 length:942 start_codon:yes stop_codon:yes gene_type:complete